MAVQALNILPTEQRDYGRYQLLCRFATGGMANLYLARLLGTQGFEKMVAIKRIHEHLTENDEFLHMFVDEARLCARISHPNVVQVIELGQIGNSHYIAMEYVEGETLSALMRRKKPPLPICARVVANSAAGLHAAHQLTDSDGELLHVVHRDVSPQNILISFEGAVKVVDFGVARARNNVHTTSAGQVKGKFAYMAPEQVELGEVDQRTDIFALGIVLWEITTGHRLFKAPNDAATVTKVKGMEILPPSMLIPDFPKSLEAVVMRALQRDPKKRYQTAEALEEDLEAYLMEVGTSVQPRHIGIMMRDVFKDRVEAKRELLVKCEDTRDLISASNTLGSQPSASLGGPSMTAGQALLAQEQRSHRRHIVAAVVTIVLGLSLLAGLIVLFRKEEPKPPPAPVVAPVVAPVEPKTAPIQKIRIRIEAQPAEAVITVDGKKVANPYSLQREVGEGELAVHIEAPNHQPKDLKIPLSESGRLVISLVKIQKARPKTKTGRKRPTKRLDEDLFGDPYGK